eukprot:3116846-Pleurochrysis_carterae.AAC.1
MARDVAALRWTSCPSPSTTCVSRASACIVSKMLLEKLSEDCVRCTIAVTRAPRRVEPQNRAVLSTCTAPCWAAC